MIEVNKTFKAAIIDPFAVSTDNGQRAESFGETLKLEYAEPISEVAVFLQW